MIETSNPPIVKTPRPLSAYMDEAMLQKKHVAFSAEKIKAVVGYKLKYPKLDQAALKEVVDKFKEDGVWPIV